MGLLLNFLFLAATSHAFVGGSTTVGDGGVIVVCGLRKPAELLDFAEARRTLGLELELTPDLLKERLSEFPGLLKTLEPRLELVQRALTFVDKAPRSLDWQESVFNGCSTFQVAFKTPSLPGPGIKTEGIGKILIAKDLFQRLPPSERFALIVHEALHEVFVDPVFPELASQAARQFLVYLAAPEAFRERVRPSIPSLIATRRPVDWTLILSSQSNLSN